MALAELCLGFGGFLCVFVFFCFFPVLFSPFVTYFLVISLGCVGFFLPFSSCFGISSSVWMIQCSKALMRQSKVEKRSKVDHYFICMFIYLSTPNYLGLYFYCLPLETHWLFSFSFSKLSRWLMYPLCAVMCCVKTNKNWPQKKYVQHKHRPT